MTSTLKKAVSGVLAILALPIGLVMGIATALGIASVVPSTLAILLGGLTIAVAAWLLAGRLVAGLLGATKPWVGAGIIAVVLVVVVSGGAMATILNPYPHQPSHEVPADVRFWDDINGARISYRTSPATGQKQPYPVIFLHGGPGTPSEGLPSPTAALNAAGFDVYAYDQIGAGRSDRLADIKEYTVGRNVDDLEAIRTTIGAEKVILVGTSWGASLAAHYIAAHPDRVERVAFVSPGSIWPKAFTDDGSSPWKRLSGEERVRYDDLISNPRMVANSILLGVNPDAAHDFAGDGEVDSWLHDVGLAGRSVGLCPSAVESGADTAVHNNLQGFYTNQMTNRDLKDSADPRPTLRMNPLPVLVMRGTCDFIVWDVARDYRETFGGATLVVVPGAGHAISAAQPDLYTETLVDFITDQALPLPAYTSDDDPSTS